MEEKTFQKTINYARSKKRGIVYQSNIHPFFSVETVRDEDTGIIHSRVIPSGVDMLFDYLGVLSESKGKREKLIILAIDVILFIASTFTLQPSIMLAAIYFSILISSETFYFTKITCEMKFGKERSTARYHAAEHMAINAYRMLQRVPTIEEVKKFSRFSATCGSRHVIYKIVYYGALCLIMITFPFLPLHVYLIEATSILFIIIFANKRGWLKYLQVFITSKPTDAELEVAVEGLRKLEEFEEHYLKELDVNDDENFEQICVHIYF